MSMGKKKNSYFVCKPNFRDSRHLISRSPTVSTGFLDKFVPRCSKHLVEGSFLPLHIPSLRHHTDLESHCPISEGKIVQDGRFQDIGIWLAADFGWTNELNTENGAQTFQKQKTVGRKKGGFYSVSSLIGIGAWFEIFFLKHMSNYVFDILLHEIFECGPWTRALKFTPLVWK